MVMSNMGRLATTGAKSATQIVARIRPVRPGADRRGTRYHIDFADRVAFFACTRQSRPTAATGRRVPRSQSPRHDRPGKRYSAGRRAFRERSNAGGDPMPAAIAADGEDRAGGGRFVASLMAG